MLPQSASAREATTQRAARVDKKVRREELANPGFIRYLLLPIESWLRFFRHCLSTRLVGPHLNLSGVPRRVEYEIRIRDGRYQVPVRDECCKLRCAFFPLMRNNNLPDQWLRAFLNPHLPINIGLCKSQVMAGNTRHSCQAVVSSLE